ncbi:2-octaprenyl-6-methoxyphenyl hydroxylase [Wolbachia endosymbiont of Howardula sp.]|uniref:2-octaprenyl-6-methoxyphenyl hydroxylase n=1 Tax=Wolbachia endosymbiont of Howardula sp. TaxID=2916816 RepID=UPI0031FE01DC
MKYDVIISGGGLLGMITAIGLNKNNISVAVIEKNIVPRILSDDNRALAISQGSKKILDQLGIWHFLAHAAEPILDISISDENNPFTLHYHHKIVSEEPMGYVINNLAIWNAINHCLLNTIQLYSPNSYKSIQYADGYVEVILDNHSKLISSLMICAEGKNSKLQTLYDIPSMQFIYKQSSIVFTVNHILHHENIAIEHFLSGGPFAMLPMKGGYSSSIVWTEKSEIADMLMELSEELFILELKKRFDPCVGTLSLDGERQLYPLSFSFAKKLYHGRILLIGDAAHSIHPLAGQGLNLGIRDIESLLYRISDAKVYGIDIGSEYLLDQISRDRLCDNMIMALFTDGINRVFSNSTLCARVLRTFGLIAVENSEFLKKIFIQYGMGIRSIPT